MYKRQIFGYDLDMMPGRIMAFFKYEDKPGVIGTVGTELGKAGINIALMQVGRHEAGGTALMGIVVDSPIAPELLETILKEVGIQDAWTVEL